MIKLIIKRQYRYFYRLMMLLILTYIHMVLLFRIINHHICRVSIWIIMSLMVVAEALEALAAQVELILYVGVGILLGF